MPHWQVTLWVDDDSDKQLRALLQNRGPAVRYVAFAFIVPIAVLAVVGYLLCVVIFPSALLKMGLDFIDGPPGIGWFLWASVILGFYLLLFLAVLVNVLRHLKARIVPIASLGHLLLFVAGYTLAARFIPAYLAG